MKIPSRYVCDRCGKDYTRNTIHVDVKGEKHFVLGMALKVNGRLLANHMDLCDDCVRSLMSWIERIPVSEPNCTESGTSESPYTEESDADESPAIVFTSEGA